jgi:hypothetical protein
MLRQKRSSAVMAPAGPLSINPCTTIAPLIAPAEVPENPSKSMGFLLEDVLFQIIRYQIKKFHALNSQ